MKEGTNISEGVYLAVLPDGTIAAGVISSNPYPKVYTTKEAAIRRATAAGGYGSRVLHVTDKGVTQVWPEARTFFLNERHELKPYGPGGGDDDR